MADIFDEELFQLV